MATTRNCRGAPRAIRGGAVILTGSDLYVTCYRYSPFHLLNMLFVVKKRANIAYNLAPSQGAKLHRVLPLCATCRSLVKIANIHILGVRFADPVRNTVQSPRKAAIIAPVEEAIIDTIEEAIINPIGHISPTVKRDENHRWARNVLDGLHYPELRTGAGRNEVAPRHAINANAVTG